LIVEINKVHFSAVINKSVFSSKYIQVQDLGTILNSRVNFIGQNIHLNCNWKLIDEKHLQLSIQIYCLQKIISEEFEIILENSFFGHLTVLPIQENFSFEKSKFVSKIKKQKTVKFRRLTLLKTIYQRREKLMANLQNKKNLESDYLPRNLYESIKTVQCQICMVDENQKGIMLNCCKNKEICFKCLLNILQENYQIKNNIFLAKTDFVKSMYLKRFAFTFCRCPFCRKLCSFKKYISFL
jgi:hypothetical protein